MKGLLLLVLPPLTFWAIAVYIWHELQPRTDDYATFALIGFMALVGVVYLWRAWPRAL